MVICVIFEGIALAGLGTVAGKIGLIIITLDRYFKIVHAIAHRKYYRNWMTKVGVALPWIGGVALTLIPAIGTTRIVNGRCLKVAVWPNKAMSFVSLSNVWLCIPNVSWRTFIIMVDCKLLSVCGVLNSVTFLKYLHLSQLPILQRSRQPCIPDSN